MQTLKQVLIPQTDLAVSSLCFGGGSLGTSLVGDEADQLLGDFVEAGGSFFDTAHCYAFWKSGGNGASERELGACLRRLGILEQSVIATKGGHPDMGPDYRRPDAYLAPEILASDISDSLNRLDLERIDLFYLHRDDTRVPVGEIIESLNREIEAGRLRYLGASNWSTQRLAEANEYAIQHGLQGFVISQVQWSLAVPNFTIGPDPTTRYVTDEDAVWYGQAKLPIAAYSATAGGYFGGKAAKGYENPVSRGRLERAQELAQRLDVTPTQINLAYLLNQEVPVFPVFGTSQRDHLTEIVSATLVALDAETVKWLRDGDAPA